MLSISKITRDTNCRAIFYDTHCDFQDRKSGRMIGNAEMINGLYYFDENLFRSKIAQGLSSTSSIFVSEQIILWHKRLGHLSFAYLKYLFPDLFKKLDCSSFQCESCHLSKSHRTTYLTQLYRASKPFYLIHSDVWGASKVTTMTEKKWFVTFIDDHTRLCWVYLMNEKSEVKSLFQDFYKMVENQFFKKINILHLDNGTEFFNECLGNFLKENGILHQSTYHDTPQ